LSESFYLLFCIFEFIFCFKLICLLLEQINYKYIVFPAVIARSLYRRVKDREERRNKKKKLREEKAANKMKTKKTT